MNIVVKIFGSDLCCCRPDTTWERENRDFYSPDCVNELHWTPVVFARISKAGKCIGEKFVSRYYDSIGFGILLYIGDFLPSIAAASCADHTSLLPSAFFEPSVLENPDGVFGVSVDAEQIYRLDVSDAGLKAKLEEALCRASALTSFRIGDYVAVELAPLSLLAERSGGEKNLQAGYCDNNTIACRVIF